MRVNHNTALRLEEIIRRLFDYPIRGRMAGYIDADHFEREPFDAALIALSPVWERVDKHELDAFCQNGILFSVTTTTISLVL